MERRRLGRGGPRADPGHLRRASPADDHANLRPNGSGGDKCDHFASANHHYFDRNRHPALRYDHAHLDTAYVNRYRDTYRPRHGHADDSGLGGEFTGQCPQWAGCGLHHHWQFGNRRARRSDWA